MAMPSLWIKTSVSLPRHPKTRSAAALLGVSIAEMVGRLIMLWTYALEFYPDGIFPSKAEIIYAVEWEGDSDSFISALLSAGGHQAGFIEIGNGDSYYLHDWSDYSGMLDGSRKKYRENHADQIRLEKSRLEKIRLEKTEKTSEKKEYEKEYEKEVKTETPEEQKRKKDGSRVTSGNLQSIGDILKQLKTGL